MKLIDMLKTKNLGKNRIKNIDKSDFSALKNEYKANEIAKKLHPKNQKAEIVRIVKETEDTYSFHLKTLEEAAFFRAGQFLLFSIYFNNIKKTRAYSISSSPKDSLNNIYTITIKRQKNGLVSNHIIDNWKIGQKIEFSAPIGQSYYDPNRDEKHVIAFAGGSGVTPFKSKISSIIDGDENYKITLFYGVRAAKDMIFKSFFTNPKIFNHPKIKIIFVFEQQSEVDKNFQNVEYGYIDLKTIEKYIDFNSKFTINQCGPKPMVEKLNLFWKAKNIKNKYVRMEKFGYDWEDLKAIGIENTEKVFNVTFIQDEKSFSIKSQSTKSLLETINSNISLFQPNDHGKYNFTRGFLEKGKVHFHKEAFYIRKADKKFNFLDLSISFPKSDLVIKLL